MMEEKNGGKMEFSGNQYYQLMRVLKK